MMASALRAAKSAALALSLCGCVRIQLDRGLTCSTGYSCFITKVPAGIGDGPRTFGNQIYLFEDEGSARVWIEGDGAVHIHESSRAWKHVRVDVDLPENDGIAFASVAERGLVHEAAGWQMDVSYWMLSSSRVIVQTTSLKNPRRDRVSDWSVHDSDVREFDNALPLPCSAGVLMLSSTDAGDAIVTMHEFNGRETSLQWLAADGWRPVEAFTVDGEWLRSADRVIASPDCSGGILGLQDAIWEGWTSLGGPTQLVAGSLDDRWTNVSKNGMGRISSNGDRIVAEFFYREGAAWRTGHTWMTNLRPGERLLDVSGLTTGDILLIVAYGDKVHLLPIGGQDGLKPTIPTPIRAEQLARVVPLPWIHAFLVAPVYPPEAAVPLGSK